MHYTEITLSSGRAIRIRPQTWPEFSAQMDAYMDLLEEAARADEAKRAEAMLAVQRHEWAAAKAKLAACLEDPDALEGLSRAEASETLAAIDRLGEEDATRKNLTAGGAGAATPTGRVTAATV